MNRAILLCGSAFAAMCGAPAFAQAATSAPTAAPSADQPPSATEPAANTLEDIIVTARRVEENQQRVPVAITTITGAALERRSVGQVSDLQFNVANLQIKPANLNASIPEFIIRGQRQVGFTDENVVTYVNGVPQSARGLTLYDLESVQALKGPQGTLFGKNSNGGAMVFTTKTPEFTTEGSVTVGYGNYDHKEATAILNLPIVDDKVAIRLAGNIERRDGVFKNVYPGGDRLGDRHVQSGRITLLLKPSERLTSQFTVDALHRNEIPAPAILEAAPAPGTSTGFAALVSILTRQALTQQSALGGGTATIVGNVLLRQGDPYITSTPTGIGTTVATGAPYAPLVTNGSRSTVYGIQNSTTYELDETLSLRNIFGYRHVRALDEQDPSGITGFLLNVSPVLTALGVPGLPANFPGRIVNNNTNTFNRNNVYSDEVQLIGKFDHFNFIAGGFYSHDDFRYTARSNFIIGPVDLYQVGPRYGREDLTTKSNAVFAQGTYDFAGTGLDGLRVTAGVRYTWDKRDYVGTNFYAAGVNANLQDWSTRAAGAICNEQNGTGTAATGVNNATACAIVAKRTYKAPTWTGSIEYQATDNTLLYFTSRRGYKAGGPNPTTSNLNFALFGSEFLTDFELGLKQQGRLGDVPYRVNIAGFVGKYKKIQTQDILTFCANPACPVGGGTYTDLIIFNVGKATIKGVELEGSVKPFPDFTFDFGYSYQVGRYGSGSIIPQPAMAGPIGTPNPIDFTTGFNLAHREFPGVPRNTLNLAGSLTLSFVPESFAKPVLSVNYAYRSRSKGLQPLGVYRSAGFGVVNARLALADLFGSTFSAGLYVQNLTDKAYRLGCTDNLNSIGYATCRWDLPRTYGGTLSVKF